jgi:hypothetical protein
MERYEVVTAQSAEHRNGCVFGINQKLKRWTVDDSLRDSWRLRALPDAQVSGAVAVAS